jgi:Flp pilus assembly protein TadD
MRSRGGRHLLAASLAGSVAAGLAGCSASLPSSLPSSADLGPQEAAASAATSATPQKSAAQRSGANPRADRNIAELAKASSENPRDVTLAMAYARALRASGKRNEALAVIEVAAEANPEQTSLAVEQGLLALELGQSAKALAALEKAAPTSTDWRVLSAVGIAASSQGKQHEAQRYFARALTLSPNNAVILNNMAMSLLLDRKVDQAEAMLRRAARAGGGRQQVAQNLALAQALKREAVVAEQ